ncbi:DUF1345 domain-containing protein [Tessaracoccus antarcticus]|uniref:DUF1345 domain-containing protein n=1 Tax=Tessaracoccus antarcticus TaxID=2479848 RepID=A0A3M0GMQ6_9ACTN|nr:DUF1345 domain-containing protein [Tessaracoccus antarcticus]
MLAGVAGGVVAAVACLAVGLPSFAPLVGWIAASGIFITWTGFLLAPMDGPSTRSHATKEDPPRRWAHVSLLVAVLASLVGVAYLVAGAGSGSGLSQALVGVVAIGLSWVLVHTLYTVRYAHLFYDAGGKGVDFEGTDEPAYGDFAYLAFTLGMTFQVSDTQLTTPQVRAAALRHALLSYLLGVVVIAITINLVVQLAGGASPQ